MRKLPDVSKKPKVMRRRRERRPAPVVMLGGGKMRDGFGEVILVSPPRFLGEGGGSYSPRN